MRILGVHIIDVAIIFVFLAFIIWISVRMSRGVKHQTDFFLGGRSLGRWLQFFLNFGNMTDSTGAPQISSSVFASGIGGIWIGFQTLFITPFYWFSTVWYRRMRLMTIADMFNDRFGSGSLAMAYAGFNVFVAILLLATGNVTTYTVAHAMMVKTPDEYTAAEKQSVDDFHEYVALKTQAQAGNLPDASRARFTQLDSMVQKGQIASQISYVKNWVFYILYASFIAIYIMLGGLKAAAICDALQGVLVLFMSVILIPFGIHAIGGFRELHNIVPADMFDIFGDPATNPYTWYAVVAITFASMIQIFGLIHNMTISGSAKDENAARIGGLSGGFSKRVILIAWGLVGLIALAYFKTHGGLSDTNDAWGALSDRLLPVGLTGLMLSGMLLGHMPAVGASSVSISALLTRNIYEPLVKGRSQRHYLRFGQLMIFVVLIVSVLLSLPKQDIVKMITRVITVNTFFGAVIVLVVYWRRLTAGAIWIGFTIWALWFGLVPIVAQYIGPISHAKALTGKTEELIVNGHAKAIEADVQAGRASAVGEEISVKRHILPRPLFFERVVLNDAKDPNSGWHGEGGFSAELYLCHLLGAPVERFTPAWTNTASWGMDGVLPFIMLMLFSLITPQSDPERIRLFHAKMKTKVNVDPELDRLALEESRANPERLERLKLFPGSNWEFCKWTKQDFLGFGACWGIVLAIMGVLFFFMQLGA